MIVGWLVDGARNCHAAVNVTLNLLLDDVLLHMVQRVFEIIDLSHCARLVEVVEESSSIELVVILMHLRPNLQILAQHLVI